MAVAFRSDKISRLKAPLSSVASYVRNPKFIYDYFPTKLRGLGTGLIYNLGATGGMAAPVLATYISGYYGLGVSLFIVTVAFSALLILLVGFDIPGKIYKLSVAK